MYGLTKVLVAQLLMPLPVLLSLLLLGLLLIWAGWRRCVLMLVSWAPVVDRLLVPLETQYAALHDLPVETDLAAVNETLLTRTLDLYCEWVQ